MIKEKIVEILRKYCKDPEKVASEIWYAINRQIVKKRQCKWFKIGSETQLKELLKKDLIRMERLK